MISKKCLFMATLLLLGMACLVLPAAAAPTFVSISPSSGPAAGGTTVIITGTELTNASSVTFDGTAASSFTVDSATQITAATPAHAAGAVSVVITATEGTASGAFTYVAPPTISGITPSNGYNSSSISITAISGTGFSTGTAPTVVLMKSGQTNITATGLTVTATSIACTVDITNKQAGTWTVVVTNPDGQAATYSGFEIKSSSAAVTLTSISPSTAQTNTTVSITSLAGTGFIASPLPQMYLKKAYTNDIYGAVSSATTTSIVGTFNLTNRVPGSYEVCVINSGGEATCGLAFTITAMASTTNGTIYFTSNPTTAKVYVDSSLKGTTPFTLYNVTPGSYNIKVQKDNYLDWADRVTVTSGNQTSVYARLSTQETSTTTIVTTIPTLTTATLPPTTKRTTPTPWPTDTATPASPVGIVVIVGGVALALLAIRKH